MDRALDVADPKDFDLSLAERRAAALGQVCQSFLDHQSTDKGGRHRPHLNGVVDLEELIRGDGHGGRYVDTDGPVAPEAMRKLVCDASWHRLLGGAATILDYGRATRDWPVNLWNAIAIRDGGCRWPGCDAPVAHCDAHHVDFWEHGGPTALHNGVLLCRHHHTRTHKPGHTLKMNEDGQVELTLPTGKLMISAPAARHPTDEPGGHPAPPDPVEPRSPAGARTRGPTGAPPSAQALLSQNTAHTFGRGPRSYAGQTMPETSLPPLRVAVDVSPLHGHRTGIGAATQQLVDALGARPDVELLPYLVSYRARPQPPQRRVPVPAAFAQRWWARLDGPKVDRWLGQPDVVHGTNYVVPPTRAPRVVSVYDCWFLTHTELATPDVQRAGHVLRRNVDAGAHVHASSHATAGVVRELLGTDRVTVVHLGPLPPDDAEPVPVAALDGVPFVVAIGTIERRKGLAGLVEAFALLADELADLRLVLAGAPGDDEAAVRAALDRLPTEVRSRVLVPGPVSAGQRAWLLANASVLAYPSLDEGFGFPVLDAQAAGVPVVATRAGSIPEVAGEGAVLVEVGDVEALAGALRRAVDDAAHRAALVAAGTANLERFDWALTAEAMVDLYRHLAPGGAGG